jgi:penicillin-binding protein 1A
LKRPQASIKSRNMVFHRMAEEGYISPEEEEAYSKKPMITATQVVDSRLTFVYDEVTRQVKKIFGEERAATGGFNIYTSIDPVIQNKAEDSVHRRLTEVENNRRSLVAKDKTAEPYPHQTFQEYREVLADFRKKLINREIDPATPKPTSQYLQGAALVLDNHDGSILALVGGRDYTHSQLNRALQSPRSPGMCFLPMVYATAFNQPQFFPGTPFEDAPFNNTKVMFGATTGSTGEWGIEADTHTFTMKPIAARQGLVHSLNSITMRLAYEAFPGVTDQTVNLGPLREQVQKMGIEAPLTDNPRNVLGDAPTKLSELCLAYTCFPNGGTRAKQVHLINKVTDAQDKVIYQVDDEVTTPVEALDPISAYQVNTCLVDALDHGTASAAHSEFGLKKFPAGGKTGTHYGFKDLWFTGYDSAVTCGVWVGFDAPKTVFEGAYSSRIAMPIWCDIMNASLQNHKPEPFKTPAGMEKMELCRRSGQRATDFCYEKTRDADGRERSVRDTYFELVRPGTVFVEPCTLHEGEGIALDLLAFQSNIGRQNNVITVRGARPVQFANVDAVRMKEPTLKGEDPYHTLKPMLQYDETKEGGVAKRAERVSDDDDASNALPIKLSLPQPLKLEP